jgi:hypothetical protein
MKRRGFLNSICRTAAVYTFDQLIEAQPLPVSFVNIAREAGLKEKNTFGEERKNRYLVETTGCGVAFFDYDHDGWLDLFFVNGSRFQATFSGGTPTNRLYRNNRDGTFTDVTGMPGCQRDARVPGMPGCCQEGCQGARHSAGGTRSGMKR